MSKIFLCKIIKSGDSWFHSHSLCVYYKVRIYYNNFRLCAWVAGKNLIFICGIITSPLLGWLGLQIVITEVLNNYRYDIKQSINVRQSTATNFLPCSLSPQTGAMLYVHSTSTSLSMSWSSQSPEEYHIAFCSCPSKMVLYCKYLVGGYLLPHARQ
jgi:hypothetical protein